MHRRWTIGTTAAAALMSAAGSAWAQYAVSQLPSLTPTPPTNIVMMIDDSGSMQWSYVPDGFGACTGWRRFNAGTFNALAYNPNITYPAPVIITASGAQQLTSSFNAAPIDGFNTATGTIDLSSAYQPTASSAPGTSTQTYSPHPGQDLATIGVTSAMSGGGQTTISGCGSGVYGGTGTSGGNQYTPATGSTTAIGAAAYYYVYDSTQTIPSACSAPGTTATSTNAAPNDDNCYRYVKVTSTSGPGKADERQNFANWYSFYRTRHLMIASAAAISMADPVLTQARVSWRALNTCTDMRSGNNCAGWDGVVVDNRIRTFAGAQQTAFYKWLTRVPAASPTPTRTTWQSIGDFFSDKNLKENGPYGINPNPFTGTAPTGELACVQNYNITLTDGQWNSDSDSPSFWGSADATATTFPDGKTYTPSTSPPTAIYSNDTNSYVLADMAFHYWATNLRPDLSGSATAVSPYYQVTTGVGGAPTTADYWNPQNDPATWPHIVQITIGVGMTTTMNVPGLPWWGNIPSTQYTQPGYMNLWNGTNAWPFINNGAPQGDTGKAYDLWHAAINSRGLAFSAESPGELVASMKASINRIKVPMSAQSAVAASSTSLNSGAVVYLASYTSSDWHGVLGAYALSTSGTLATTPTWSTNNAATFASATTRSLITSNTASATAAPSVGSGIAFSSSSATFSTIWGAVAGANANNLSWLRGDATQERRNGGAYRDRVTTVLGDIVDSAPVFAWHENFGYSILPEGGNYLTFISGKGNTPGSIYSGQGMVYVGANDGMLHGFDASTGFEVFGYVPHNVIPNLPALADPAYAHRFYVDQTAYVGDACVGSGPTSCSWKSILVGTTGAGGQGVFALDVTNPASMESTGSASSNVLWDLDGKGDLSTNPTNPKGDPDLGYPVGKPIIARLNNGDWSAIFGNGYLSARGCAVLFIVRLSDGTVTKLDTSGLSSTSTCTGTNINAGNGLGPVTLSDVNGDMITDFVYAGDLQGNLWKFDLSSTSSGSWTVAFGGQPLFTASPGGGSCVQAATSTAANTCQPITSAPVLGPPLTGMSGTMVYFGTGRMFANGDASTTSTQSFYGVLDQGGSSPVSGGQGALVAQTITDAGTTRTIGFNAVTSPKLGWFMNLPDTGERVTMSPILVNGYVLFATQIPSSNTCTASGSGWIMAVKASTNTTGGFDTPNFFYGQSGVSGIQSTVGVIQGVTVLSDSANKQDRFLAGGTKGVQSFASSTGAAKGRMSWHELVR